VKGLSVKLLSRLHTIMYRATGGSIGRRLVNNDMLLLTTTGRRTGARHTVPLLYLRDKERFVVIASYGGRPQHPEWYLNLLAQPEATVQIERTITPVSATAMSQTDRDVWWARVVTAYSDYATYQSRTNRQIPLVWLEPRTENPYIAPSLDSLDSFVLPSGGTSEPGERGGSASPRARYRTTPTQAASTS